MSITVFPKTVKKYTVVNDKLFEDTDLYPTLTCYEGENGTLQIKVALDYDWNSLCPMIECENSKGAKDKGGVLSDFTLSYIVPRALMQNGVLRFHLKGISDGKIRKTSDAEIEICSSFDTSGETEKYEPTAFEDLTATVGRLIERCAVNDRSIERFASDMSSMELNFSQKIADRDLVTSALMNSGGVTNLDYAFEETSITEFPALDMSKVQSMQYSFRNCASLLEIYDCDLSSCTTLYECFRGCTALKKVGKLKTAGVKKMYSLFRNCSSLETIDEIDFSSVDSMNLIFANCRKLQNITFVGSINISIDFRNTSATRETLISAFNALCQNGEGKTVFVGALASKLTEEDKKIATDKGWTVE